MFFRRSTLLSILTVVLWTSISWQSFPDMSFTPALSSGCVTVLCNILAICLSNTTSLCFEAQDLPRVSLLSEGKLKTTLNFARPPQTILKLPKIFFSIRRGKSILIIYLLRVNWLRLQNKVSIGSTPQLNNYSSSKLIL